MIAFIRSNPVVSDPRVEKEVTSLTSNGFRVTVLAWDREGVYDKYELHGKRIVWRLRLPVAYNKLVVIAYYPIFWFWVLSKLFKLHPKIVHSCDLDSILPALFYRFLTGRSKVIFDVFDNYGVLITTKSEIISSIVRSIELLSANKSDALITVANERLKFFNTAKLPSTEIIMNCPPQRDFEKVKRKKQGFKTFQMVYAGNIAQDRGLIMLAEATRDIDNIEIMLAGRVVDIEVLSCLKNFSHVNYIGQVSFDESLMLQKSADVIPILYDPQVPINKLASPNKLFEAMMLGVPVITNVCKDLVEGIGCGLIVEYDLKNVKQNILSLKDNPLLRREMGLNGRLAFERKYNWELMEKKLLNLYTWILAKRAKKKPLELLLR